MNQEPPVIQIEPNQTGQEVTVIGIQLSIKDMIFLLFKLLVAAIPVAIVVFILFTIIEIVVVACLMSMP